MDEIMAEQKQQEELQKENEVLDKTLRAVTEAVEIMIDKDTKEAMNKCNGFDALKCV